MALSDIRTLAQWWQDEISRLDQRDVIARVRTEAGLDGRYMFMVLMSAGIAILGLLQSSPAVVIGAMLISPLMGPIIGLGFALATIDSAEIRRTILALAVGAVVAVAFTALIVVVSPLQNVTGELAARTRPNLFDLVIAILSALAGTYATIRGRAGTVVGVAIATALMPPLATIGFGIATLNGTVASGAALLFVTNFVAITLTAAVMARLYGFARSLSPRQTMLGTLIVIAAFGGLAIPLGLSLRQIAWETRVSRDVRTVLADEFGDAARLSQVAIDFAAQPLSVKATALTPTFKADAARRAEAALRARLGQPVDVAIAQYRVGEAQAEAATLADAKNAQDVAERRMETMTADLALIAGVEPDDVLVDQRSRRAQVRASVLPGAGLATYRALEARIADVTPGWQILLEPPAVALPEIGFIEGAPDADAVALAVWAARRRGLALTVTGPEPQASALADAFRAQGIDVALVSGTGAVRLDWRTSAAPAR